MAAATRSKRSTGTVSHEKQEAPAKPASVPHPLVDLRDLPRRRMDAAGNELAENVTEGHAITHFPTLGLMFDVRKPKSVSSLKQAQAHAKKVDLLGRKGDWVVGEDVETQLIVDRKFSSPAVNKAYFPNMPDSGWIYSATKTAWSSSSVWFVDLNNGNVRWLGDDDSGFVVPVLRVSASQ